MSGDPIAKKSLGQHWLRDEASLAAMCQAAEVEADDTILEIGPGLGTLTELLVSQAKYVVAVEFDKKLAERLSQQVPADNLQVITQDILTFDWSTLPVAYKIVANIPYYLTSNLIRVISETPNPPAIAALLLQREVAERVAAGPGSMSLLSVTTQFYWSVHLGLVVPSDLFEPAPKVDSQILILKRRNQPLFNDVDTKTFFRLVKAGFSQRRKTLLNSLSGGLQMKREAAQSLCLRAGIDPARRAQTLSHAEWHRLYQSFHA